MLHQTNPGKFVAIIKKHIPKTTHSTNNNIHILNDIDVVTIVSFDPSN